VTDLDSKSKDIVEKALCDLTLPPIKPKTTLTLDVEYYQSLLNDVTMPEAKKR